jgi:very-short-patch-repair endonuclease
VTRFDRNKFKTARARHLRRSATPPEQTLWLKLRGGQLGASFRRQHPIGPYILDFYAPSLKLAIEVDGGQHALLTEHDAERSRFLNAKGIRVMRFWNGDVLRNLDGVAEEIWLAIKASTPTRSAERAPTSPFQGEES